MADSGFKLCPFCKEQIRQESIKCRFCGEWLEPSESDSARTLTHGLWGYAVFGALLSIFGALVAKWVFGK
jgi:hypothetical protein